MPSCRKPNLFDFVAGFISGVVSLLAIVGIGYAIGQIAWHLAVGEPKNPLSVEEAAKMADDVAPFGSPPDAVYQWLRSKHFIYSSFQDDDLKSGLAKSGDRSIIQESHINPAEIGMVINAEIPDTRRDALLRQDIFLYFFFDRTNRLIKTMARPHNTTP
jgi:hypothetical protein